MHIKHANFQRYGSIMQQDKVTDDLKICYLDIDGVLNSGEGHELIGKHKMEFTKEPIEWIIPYETRGDYVNKQQLQLLHTWYKQYDIQFVIVSSWAGSIRSPEDVATFLDIPIHSYAFNTGGGYGRGRGVILHAQHYRINNYVILDDSWRQMYEDWSHNVRVNGRIGLTELDLLEANEILGIV